MLHTLFLSECLRLNLISSLFINVLTYISLDSFLMLSHIKIKASAPISCKATGWLLILNLTHSLQQHSGLYLHEVMIQQ
jgi:hypothetical protein